MTRKKQKPTEDRAADRRLAIYAGWMMGRTLKDMGKEYGISPERVRQIFAVHARKMHALARRYEIHYEEHVRAWRDVTDFAEAYRSDDIREFNAYRLYQREFWIDFPSWDVTQFSVIDALGMSNQELRRRGFSEPGDIIWLRFYCRILALFEEPMTHVHDWRQYLKDKQEWDKLSTRCRIVDGKVVVKPTPIENFIPATIWQHAQIERRVECYEAAERWKELARKMIPSNT